MNYIKRIHQYLRKLLVPPNLLTLLTKSGLKKLRYTLGDLENDETP